MWFYLLKEIKIIIIIIIIRMPHFVVILWEADEANVGALKL